MRFTLSLILSVFTLLSCSTYREDTHEENLDMHTKRLVHFPNRTDPTGPKKLDPRTYAEKLNATKNGYPFATWRESFDDGLEQYNQENCEEAKAIFDTLISDLITLGEQAPEKEEIALFQKAIEATNELEENIIETTEREDLCELTNSITIACGLNPVEYGDGEGLASEWREW
jgi:hypothetical protein